MMASLSRLFSHFIYPRTSALPTDLVSADLKANGSQCELIVYPSSGVHLSVSL